MNISQRQLNIALPFSMFHRFNENRQYLHSFYSGTAGDMETSGRLNIGGPHKGQRFSTKDRDWDDNDSDNCAGSLTF